MSSSTVTIKIQNQKQLDDLLAKLAHQVSEMRNTMKEISEFELEVGVESKEII